MRLRFLLMFAAMACGKITPLKEPKKLEGLSGTAYYYFSNKDNKCFMILKEEYKGHPTINVILTRDTVRENEAFEAEIVVLKKDYKIILNDSALYDVKEDGGINIGRWKYNYHPEKSGLYEFKGVIKYDSIVEPFEYKFIVIL